jgi:hypothetical protein
MGRKHVSGLAYRSERRAGQPTAHFGGVIDATHEVSTAFVGAVTKALKTATGHGRSLNTAP